MGDARLLDAIRDLLGHLSRVLMEYFFKPENPPWPHQHDAFKFAEGKAGAGLFLRMGGGKTRLTIDIAYNMRAKMTIVLCPKTVIDTWVQQIGQHWPSDDWAPVVAGFRDMDGRSLEHKLNGAKLLARTAAGDGRPFILLINY